MSSWRCFITIVEYLWRHIEYHYLQVEFKPKKSTWRITCDNSLTSIWGVTSKFESHRCGLLIVASYFNQTKFLNKLNQLSIIDNHFSLQMEKNTSMTLLSLEVDQEDSLALRKQLSSAPKSLSSTSWNPLHKEQSGVWVGPAWMLVVFRKSSCIKHRCWVKPFMWVNFCVFE